MAASLTSDQEYALELTLQGRKTREIAAALHVNRSTVTRWKQLKSFQDALRASRLETLDATRELASEASRDMLSILLQIARNEKASDASRTKAAWLVLTYGQEQGKLAEMEQLISEMEARFNEHWH